MSYISQSHDIIQCQVTITWATQPITWHHTTWADNHMRYVSRSHDIIQCQVTTTWGTSADHMTLYNVSLPLPPFSNFCGEVEWSEPGCISSWYVRFEDIDESKKERKGGEACWVGGREGEREGVPPPLAELTNGILVVTRFMFCKP